MLLEEQGYRVRPAPNGKLALRSAKHDPPDLILLDIMMPEMDGYEVCRRLKEDEDLRDIPVLFISALTETLDKVKAFGIGGVDYITKPFQIEEVHARVETHLGLRRLQLELEERNRELEETHRQLEETQAQLIEELEKELQTAHDMQMGLMPTAPPRIEGFDIAGRCIPASHVGGDYFQYFERNGKLVLCLADVTGHAMEAAIPVVMFSGILENQMEGESTLEELFDRLNRSLHRIFLDSLTCVCFAMGELDLSSRTFRLSNGGCPDPYHYRASTGELIELQVSAHPLGVRRDTTYRVMETQLQTGDRVVFCSDGIIEAMNASRELFGYERTEETICKVCAEDLSSERMIDRILEIVSTFRGDTPLSDDTTLVVVKVWK